MGAVTAEQQKLVLNAFAMMLQNNLVTSDVVTWNEYDGEMDDRNGLQIIEQTTPRYNVTRTEQGVRNLTTGTDGTVWGSELFEVTGTFNANMGWGDFVKIQTVGQARESKALMGAAVSMAERIDAYILGVAVNASNNWVGAGAGAGGAAQGTSINSWVDAVRGYTRIKEEGVGDNDLSYVLNYTDMQQLGDQVVKLPAPDRMSSMTYREGFTGMINGVRTMFTNQLPSLTVGTRVANAPLINGANQFANYADVAKAGTVNGRSMTQTIAVDGLTGTQTIRAGEVFTIAGVFAYDNRKQARVQPERLQQFTVVQDATAVAGAIAALRIFPAIITPTNSSGSADNANINIAHATVNAAPADNAQLTFIGAAGATLSPRAIIQKEAIVVNTVPLIRPASDTSMRRRLSKIPLTVRMWQHSDFYTGEHGVRFDVAINANIRERRRICRINGDAPPVV